MEFLSGYGSDDSTAEGSPPPEGSSSPARETEASAEETEVPASQAASHRIDLPKPTVTQAPLFSGIPAPARRKKLPKATFGVPIDFGELTDDITEESKKEKRTLKAPEMTGQGRFADMLPAPKNPTHPRQDASRVAVSDDEDEAAALGARDATAMVLGPESAVGEERALTSGRPAGVAMGVPNPGMVWGGSHPDVLPPQGLDAEAFMAAGIQLKEVNAAQLRHMDPGQRAEADAMRSALGSGYEARLRREAGPDVGKTAKRKHQLTSLYQQSKLQELDQIEKNAMGARNRTETKRKYGWA